ncbi:hypothetical protein HED48_22610 [Ochrobactrum intermedium]|nr:hypothetical protein [Brucella intermedia]
MLKFLMMVLAMTLVPMIGLDKTQFLTCRNPKDCVHRRPAQQAGSCSDVHPPDGLRRYQPAYRLFCHFHASVLGRPLRRISKKSMFNERGGAAHPRIERHFNLYRAFQQ